MKELLYKELKLSLHPTVIIFLSFALMLLIPAYPYYVAFYYITLGIFFTFINGRENGDVAFTATLPVKKSDCVKARCGMIAIIELAQMVLAIPVAVISVRINPNGANAAGIEPNVAFFGLVLVMFSLFNLIFIPGFYKTAYKLGGPYLTASAVMFIYVAACELCINLIPPLKSFLDTADPAAQVKQLPILACCALIYALSMLAAYKRGARNFSKVDL